MYVSTATIICIAVSLVICIALPIAGGVRCRKKYGAQLRSLFLGAFSFVFFALVLEQRFHRLVLGAFPAIGGNLWLYALYGGMAAAVFEEFGRLCTMRILLYQRLNQGEALMYGVGHGGIEALLITGSAMMSNLVMAFALNQGNIGEVVKLGNSTLLNGINQLTQLPAWQFLLGGVERISAFFLHIGLSVLVYLAVSRKRRGYFLLALLIHFLVDAATVLLSRTIPVWLMEGTLLAFVLELDLLIFKEMRKPI